MGEPGEIGRLVADYQENKTSPAAAPRTRTEPEPPPPAEIASVPLESEAAAAAPATEPPLPRELAGAWAQARLFAAADLSTEALAKVEIPTTTSQAAALRAPGLRRGRICKVYFRISVFAFASMLVSLLVVAPVPEVFSVFIVLHVLFFGRRLWLQIPFQGVIGCK